MSLSKKSSLFVASWGYCCVTSQDPSTVQLTRRPLVSVMMNCYNGETYLVEAIDSVLAQTYQNWEVIFWDNRSTDRSADIFRSYDDPRFFYFLAPEHTAFGQARNLSVGQARGEWVAFLDCDDLWLPNKTEKQVAIIREAGPKLGLVYGDAAPLIEADGLTTYWGQRSSRLRDLEGGKSFPEGNVFPTILKGDFIPLVSAVVRRSAFIAVGGLTPGLRQAEDYELFVKISKDYEVRALKEICCHSRIHSSNLSHIQSEESYNECLSVVSACLPAAEALAGMRRWKANYAGYLLRQRFYKAGIKNLLQSGEFIYFFRRLIRHLRLVGFCP